MAELKSATVLAALIFVASASTAHAGGLEANGYNWDLLFDPATYAAKATVTHVSIDQDIMDATGAVIATSPDRVHYNLAVKADLSPAAACLISAQNPFGSDTDRDAAYAAPLGLPVRERVSSFDAGLTCSYGFEAGPGIVRVIGGISAQTLNYDADIIFFPTATPTSIALNGTGMGWRAGLAYEIEEIALRISAIYNASVSYDLDGSALAGTPFAGPAGAQVSTPQSFEVKAQTGIAPGWLALASVKWVDWSVLQRLSIDSLSPLPLGSDLYYRDGWTVTGGIGHAVTPDLTLLGSLTWDRGTSTPDASGVLVSGSQTDRWGAALGAAYDIAEAIELSGGISYSVIGKGSNLAGETWDRGSVLAISASLKASF